MEIRPSKASPDGEVHRGSPSHRMVLDINIPYLMSEKSKEPKMAFLPGVALRPLRHTAYGQTADHLSPRRVGPKHLLPLRQEVQACTPVPSPEAFGTPSESGPARVAPIPSSLADAASQAVAAVEKVLADGRSRAFIEVDLSAGDATYTLLKNTLPLVPMLLPLFPARTPESRCHILLPDAGAAALAKRDWPPLPEHVVVAGLEQAEIGPAGDEAVIIIAPRASDVEKLSDAVDSAAGLPIVIVNPDLVDMGVTGLSLNARQLRKQVIDTFVPAYYLKTFGWGVLLRAFPGAWGLWVDAPGTAVGFRLVGEVEKRPSLEEIDDVLEGEGGGSGAGFFGSLKRFLTAYMKG